LYIPFYVLELLSFALSNKIELLIIKKTTNGGVLLQ
jgi:hypothetical protein